MRVIKFRAWDGKKMVAAQHLAFWNGCCYLNASGTLNDPNAPHKAARLKGASVSKVMQYTGVKTTADREIWEGDIIKTERGFICEVFWGEFKGELKGYPKAIAPFKMTGWVVKNNLGEVHELGQAIGGEIIGNAYENPELLTKKP